MLQAHQLSGLRYCTHSDSNSQVLGVAHTTTATDVRYCTYSNSNSQMLGVAHTATATEADEQRLEGCSQVLTRWNPQYLETQRTKLMPQGNQCASLRELVPKATFQLAKLLGEVSAVAGDRQVLSDMPCLYTLIRFLCCRFLCCCLSNSHSASAPLSALPA